MAARGVAQTSGKPVDGRAGVFQRGVVLHEILTGERLFHAASDADKVRAVCSRPVRRPSTTSNPPPPCPNKRGGAGGSPPGTPPPNGSSGPTLPRT